MSSHAKRPATRSPQGRSIVSPGYRQQRFRFNWLAPDLALTPIILLYPVYRYFTGSPVDPAIPFWGLCTVWSGVGLLYYLFPTWAGPDGLGATDGLGHYHETPWGSIRRVTNLFGFFWIRHGKFGTALCVPRFLMDREGFRDYVAQHAPEDNPLRIELERVFQSLPSM